MIRVIMVNKTKNIILLDLAYFFSLPTHRPCEQLPIRLNEAFHKHTRKGIYCKIPLNLCIRVTL